MENVVLKNCFMNDRNLLRTTFSIRFQYDIDLFFTDIQPGSCAFSNICATFASEQDDEIVSMDIVTDKKPYGDLGIAPQTDKTGPDKRDWAQCSQAIATVMSRRMSELGLTQKMLAGKMNCTQQYISKMLKGEKNMSLETICKIEHALGIEIIKRMDENEQ